MDCADRRLPWWSACWVGAMLAACVPAADLTGTRFRCDEQNGCPDGQSCIAGSCETTVPDPDCTGPVTGSMTFDGVDDLVTYGNPALLSFGMNESITIAGWIKPEPTVAYQQPIVARPAACGSAGNYVLDAPDGRVRFCYLNADQTIKHCAFLSPDPVPDRVWTHIAVSYTFGVGNTLRGYIDGQLANMGVWDEGSGDDAPFVDLAAAVEVGHIADCPPSPQYFFAGELGDLRVYDRAVDGDEILRLAHDDLGGLADPDLSFPGFDGSDDVMNLGAESEPPFSAGDQITIIGRVAPATSSGFQTVVGKPIPCAHPGNYMVDVSGGPIRFCYSGPDLMDQCARLSDGSVPLGEWTHFAVTYTFGDGATVRGYIDGEPVQSGRWLLGDGNMPPVVDPSHETHVGHYAGCQVDPVHFYRGRLDRIRVLRRTLTPSEVRADYESFRTVDLCAP